MNLSKIGISESVKVLRNLSGKTLCDISVKNNQGKYSKTGALLVYTGKHTGRAAKDRWLVKEEKTSDLVNWNKTHQAISEDNFDKLYALITSYLSKKEQVYMFDGRVGADIKTSKKVRAISEYPHQAFFISKLLRQASEKELENFEEELLMISASDLLVDNYKDYGLNSGTFIVTHLTKNIVIIGGTHYAGERKKSAFSWMNFILPDNDVCPMHCSANVGHDDKVAIFFGLSGTGKTTLSADENRFLIGDDEHGWTADGSVFNMEGGCYAKGIDLDKANEPIIWNAIKEGSMVENVVEKAGINDLDFDFSDTSFTQNSRIAYGMENVPNRIDSGVGKGVKTIIFLTADASGTIPPVAKLNIDEAKYHYISGYTSKLAGTEIGVTEPVTTFSAYFGEPFFARKPMVYANILAKRIEENPGVSVFLINTGWNGKGKRISLPNTRAIVTAALDGKLDKVEYKNHSIFKFAVPKSCPGLSDQSILDPTHSWADKDLYWESAKKLAVKFSENIKKFNDLTDEVIVAGPHR
jgi:phosphoenolpyruvate carboxykinase (ATP)